MTVLDPKVVGSYIKANGSPSPDSNIPRHNHRKDVSESKANIQYKKSLKDFKKYAKKFIILFIFLFLLFVAIALAYFYLEHCFDPQQIEGQTKHLWQLCQYILHQNDNNPNTTHLIDICKYVSQPVKIECELTKNNFFKYFDLTGHIAFTVGYGNIVPNSDAGKIFTMIIILPFIASAMTTYAYTGEIITSSIQMFLLTVRQKVFHVTHLKHLTIQTLCMQLMITMLLWLSLAVNHYAVYPDDRFINSAYYSMVTISTVGFGDYPWKSEEFLNAGFMYWILSMFLFLFSLGTFAASISQVNKFITETSSKKVKEKLLKMKKKRRSESREQTEQQEQLENIKNNNKQCNCFCHHNNDENKEYENKEIIHSNAYVNHLF